LSLPGIREKIPEREKNPEKPAKLIFVSNVPRARSVFVDDSPVAKTKSITTWFSGCAEKFFFREMRAQVIDLIDLRVDIFERFLRDPLNAKRVIPL
jgi:hypothetical protein